MVHLKGSTLRHCCSFHLDAVVVFVVAAVVGAVVVMALAAVSSG